MRKESKRIKSTKLLRRTLCGVLSLAMVVTSVSWTPGKRAKAAEDEVKFWITTPSGSDKVELTRTSTEGDGDVGGEFSASMSSFSYGDTVALSLTVNGNAASGATFGYQAKADDNALDSKWNKWSDNIILKPGSYYAQYTFGDYYDSFGNYGFVVKKATLETPTAKWRDAKWDTTNKNNAIATWTKVDNNTTDENSTVPDGAISGYMVTLYKDNTQIEQVTTDNANTLTYDFSSVVATKDFGNYTFEVIPVIASSYKDCYENAISSDASGELVVPDTTAPVVNTFTADSDNNEFELTATDKDSNIVAYAFSTNADAKDSDLNWYEVSGDLSKTLDTSYSTANLDSGNYYAYVKDACGLIGKSSNTVAVTKITYNNIYTDVGVKTTRTSLYTGIISSFINTSRTGYTFVDWYKDKDFETNATTSNVTMGSDNNLYAKWNKNDISVSISSTDDGDTPNVKKTYNGNKETLTATVTDKDGNIDSKVTGWQWYKDGKAISGATSSTYEVKDASDSGVYTVKATVKLDDDSDSEVVTSANKSTVTIKKIDITLEAKDKTITYGDTAPDYDYTKTSGDLVDGESLAGVITGAPSSEYKKGDKADTYTIIVGNLESVNYNITFTKGTLTVNPKAGTGSDISIAAIDDQVFTGTAITPELTITDTTLNKKLVLDTDYKVTYSNNINVGTATATINYKDNYTGVGSATFNITKATITDEEAAVIVNSGKSTWTYGDSVVATNISSILENYSGSVSSGDIVFYYKEKSADDSTKTETMPTNAGTYVAWVEIAPDNNYKAYTTPEAKRVEFTIERKEITITAASAEKVYDGNALVANSYTITSGGTETTADNVMPYSDSFKSITVTGSRTDVGSSENEVTYTLSSATDADNYKITTENGTLKVTKASLSAPTDVYWSTSVIGTADWSPVNKTGLTSTYVVRLYRENGEEDTLIRNDETTNAYYDFSRDIKSDSSSNGVAGYYFKVKVKPGEGEDNSNYSASNFSEESEKTYTLKLNISIDGGVDSVLCGTDTSDTVYLISGETIDIHENLKSNYSAATPVWTTESNLVTFKNANSKDTSLTVSNLYAGSEDTITACSNDDAPVITSFTGTASSTQATLELNVQDAIGLAAVAITTSSEAPSTDSTEWVEKTGTSNSYSLDISAASVDSSATYYAYVKDTAGNITKSDSISVYILKFDANGGTGEMSAILKVQDVNITLPDNEFTRAGYTFQNWYCTATKATYTDKGVYKVNKSTGFKAQWTDKKVSYIAKYYFMDTDGNYPEEPSQSNTYYGTYGSEILCSSSALDLGKTGFTLDTEKSTKINSLTEDDRVIKIYLARNKHTVTYTLTKVDNSTETTVENHYYGESLTELAKTKVAGYEFVGWLYSSGTLPSTMPDKDITATASYTAKEGIEYVVNYYTENVLNDSYSIYRSETRYDNQDTEITANSEGAGTIEGFTYKGVIITAGAEAGATVDEDTISSDTKTGTVSAVSEEKLYINYYYSRNKYSITLNVIKGGSSSTIYTHTFSNIKYGTTITASEYENYDKDNWTDSLTDAEKEDLKNNYALSDYADWSSGYTISSMPASDVIVKRTYVPENMSPYYVQTYLEKSDGTYKESVKLIYYGVIGKTVTAGSGSGYDVDVTSKLYKDMVDNLSDYTLAVNNDSINSGEVTDAYSEPALTLKLYFDRKTVTARIRYIYAYDNNGKLVQEEFAHKDVQGKWGTTYTVDRGAYFYGNSNPSDSDLVFDDTVNIEGSSKNAKTFNFNENNYAVYSRNVYYNGYDHSYGNEQIKKSTNNGIAKGTGTFGHDDYSSTKESNNVYYVYYTKVDRTKTYNIDVNMNLSNLTARDSTVYNNRKISDTDLIPVTKTIGDDTYYIRYANKSDLFKYTENTEVTDAYYKVINLYNTDYY
ncbi:MAG: InlB B-repeat-containing protein, partial [Butyrivibrio sp.]|nr:InlB B-repeat-containing protein [Butyrivibrio sp.]